MSKREIKITFDDTPVRQVCFRCDKEFTFPTDMKKPIISEIEWSESVAVYSYKCPHCGGNCGGSVFGWNE